MDLKETAEVDNFLSQLGWEPPESYIEQRYGRPIARAGEAALKRPMAPSPFGGGPGGAPPFGSSDGSDGSDQSGAGQEGGAAFAAGPFSASPPPAGGAYRRV